MPKQRKCPKCKGEIVKHSVETNLGLVVVYACASCGHSFFEEKKAAKQKRQKPEKKISAKITHYVMP